MTYKEYCDNEIIASFVSECEQSDCRACEKCPLLDACLYYYTGDDSKFDEEQSSSARGRII